MKKILLAICIVAGATTYAQSNVGAWFGKERGTPGVELHATYINNETNIKNSSHINAQSMSQEIELDKDTSLLVTVHRTENDMLILHGTIGRHLLPGYVTKDFRFKAYVNDHIQGWYINQQYIEFNYEKWTIRLDWDKDLLGLLKVQSLVYRPFNEEYKQKYNLELVFPKNEPNSHYSTENHIERHTYPDQTDIHHVKLEALKSDKKIKAKFLLSNENDMKEFAHIKVFDPDKKATDFKHRVLLSSKTSGEILDTTMIIE